MVWIKDGSLFRDTCFSQIPGVVQFTTGRDEGNLKEDKNWQRFTAQYSCAGWALCEQIHGNGIALVTDTVTDRTVYPGVDGLITGHSSVALGVFTADCVPVFFADMHRKTVGIVHAGREGIRKGIVTGAVRILKEECGCSPSTLLVSLGPHIGPCCYTMDGRALDLKEKIMNQLVQGGIPAEDISSAPWCTGHQPHWFFSYRKENRTENRMFSVIGIL